MRKHNVMLTPLVLLLGCLMLASPAQAASFDCAKAQTKVEHLICDNPEISKLDDELSTAYKAALKDEKQGDSIKQAQKQWLKERNGCSDAACVKQTYEIRWATLNSHARAVQTVMEEMPFTLLKGAGVPVCEAYLKRLNVSEFGAYEKLPTCGRPENDSVDGFTKLNRVPLTVAQIAALYGGVVNFSSQGNRNRDSSQHSNAISANASIEDTRQLMSSGSIIAWHYDPPVDIDNDGKQDTDIVVWKGYGLRGGVGAIRCGGHLGAMDKVLSQPTVIFSIDWQQMELNEARTRELFEHPLGGYPVIFHDKREFADDFRPIGLEMGIFAYQGQYYFDTFFDGWGDFQGKRRSDWGDGKRRIKNDLRDILGVFQRKHNVTKQICEYRWNEFEQYSK